jgi:homogentisate 1,2-dioxygenase
MQNNGANPKYKYLSGLGSHHMTEALAGVLPKKGNSPQRLAHGLYAEQLSGTAFTSVRSENRRTWMYRRRPSVSNTPAVMHEPSLKWETAPLKHAEIPYSPMRWAPLVNDDGKHDFLSGMETVGANGDASMHAGCAIHIYTAHESMHDVAVCNADGELLIVPQAGVLCVQTEMGYLEVAPGEITVIPRGVCFRVEVSEPLSRGYVLENYGAMLRLPELGPIGANGLASPKDFLFPVAHYDLQDHPFRLVTKLAGRFYEKELTYSPFDVVAWHGNLAPYKYDLENFNVFGSVSFDSPDPSISTVLTSPSHLPGTADIDFVAFPPRWQVAEDTFRPPFFHKNVMTEFMGMVYGTYEGKATGFPPGAFSLHTSMTPHGPDKDTFESGSAEAMQPHKLEATLAFMFETRLPLRVLNRWMVDDRFDRNYVEKWAGFVPAKLPL